MNLETSFWNLKRIADKFFQADRVSKLRLSVLRFFRFSGDSFKLSDRSLILIYQVDITGVTNAESETSLLGIIVSSTKDVPNICLKLSENPSVQKKPLQCIH